MKKIMILLMFFVLTGCTSNIIIEITDNGEVIEYIEALQDNQEENSNNINFLETNFLKGNEEYIIEVLDEMGLYNRIGKRNYETINDFNNNSSITSKIIKKPIIKENKKTLEFNFTITPNMLNSEEIIESANNYNFIIKLPFKAKDNNADKYDKETNIYTWNINKEKDTNIYLKLDKTKLSNYKASQLDGFIILGSIIGGLILIGGIIALFIFIKGRKENKL